MYSIATLIKPYLHFHYATSITFPTAEDISACNAYEQDFQINDGQHIFNWGFLFGTGLRVWNGGGLAKWERCPHSPG